MAKQHFTHPHPLLFDHSDDQIYRCNGCCTAGFGRRYRCHSCNFDLHEFCANCPSSLLSPVHPLHELHLLSRQCRPTAPVRAAVTCAVCRNPIDGLFYSCSSSHQCDFNVHPFCTQLPNELRHVIDNKHPLKLHICMPGGACAICGSECSSWCYCCVICGVNIHLSCVLHSPSTNRSRRLDSSHTSGRWIPNQGVFSHAHGYGAPAYWAPYYNGHWVYHGQSYPYAYAQQSSNAGGNGGGFGFGQPMFAVINNLALGVISNIIFGFLGSPTFF